MISRRHFRGSMRACLRVCLGLALSVCSIAFPLAAGAGSVVDRNPFDPERKPWKTPPPPLPELTSKDLQIEAVIFFGSHREIVAQLDGRLKGTLPANAAGKVRIRLGQTFGGGYVLDAVTPNQATILAGAVRHTVPILRRAYRGAPPAPAQQVADTASHAPVPAPAPASAPAAAPAPAAVPGGTAMAPPVNPFAALSAPAPAVATPPAESGTTNPAPAQGNPEPAGNEASQAAAPASLLDALRKAQESKGRQNAGSSGIPFGAK